MRKRFLSLLVLLFLLVGCVVVPMPGVEPLEEKTLLGTGREKILLIDISGVLRDRRGRNILGAETRRPLTARVREELDMARGDSRIKALLLRINTPGGHVTTADIIYHEIEEYKKDRGVPVVAELMETAASGGYYIASAADEIIAQPTGITGSIGVVAYNVNAEGLLEKIGVSDMTIKSGEKKDMGSPLREMTGEEREILQSIIDELYERFLSVIYNGRKGKISMERLREISDGRVYTARQARELGLIDRTGYMEDAVAEAKRLAGLDEARVVTYAEGEEYRKNIYSGAPGPVPEVVNLLNIDASLLGGGLGGIKFMYIWLP